MFPILSPSERLYLPASVLGAFYWYDFTDSNALSLSGSAITRAVDKTGQGRSTNLQNTPTARPTLTAGQCNGFQGAVFDGGDFFALPSSVYANLATGDNTIFSVAKCTDNTARRNITTMADAGNGRYKLSFGTAAGVASATTVSFSSNTSGTTTGVNNTSSTNTNYQIITAFRSSTTESIQINNGTAVTGSSGTAIPAITAGGLGASSSGATPLIGTIMEVFTFNVALPLIDRINMAQYLSNRYAIALVG